MDVVSRSDHYVLGWDKVWEDPPLPDPFTRGSNFEPYHAARETLLVGATRTFMCFGARYNVYSRLAAATEGLRAASLLRFSICDCSGAARTLGRLQP